MERTAETNEANAFAPDVRSLHWLFTSPVLIQNSNRTASQNIVSDQLLATALNQDPTFLRRVIADPRALAEHLEPAKKTRRLGRYLESLMEFAISRLLRPSRLQMNLPVQSNKRTIGELDLIFDSSMFSTPQHWELSVKFYLCTSNDPVEQKQSRFFMGTFVEDRLDRKIHHLFEEQLKLIETPEAVSMLRACGWNNTFENKALMKGLFFYPSETDWQKSALPEEIAPSHERGWWSTSSEPRIPLQNPAHRFMQLGQLQWLGRFEGWVDRDQLMTKNELEDFIRSYFEGYDSPDWLRRRELTFAEVEITTEENENGRVYIKEVARGHIVHKDWPNLARWAAQTSITDLNQSLKQYSRRPKP